MQELEGSACNARASGIGKLWSQDVLHLAACLETVTFGASIPTGRGELWPAMFFCFQVEILEL